MNDELNTYDKEFVWAVMLTLQKSGDIYNVTTSQYTDSDFMHLLHLLYSKRYIRVKGDGRSSKFELTEKGVGLLNHLHKVLGKRGLYQHFLPNYQEQKLGSVMCEIYVPNKQTVKKMRKNTFISDSPTV